MSENKHISSKIVILETDLFEPAQIPPYGTNLYKYIEKQTRETVNSFLGEKNTPTLHRRIQEAVNVKLRNFEGFMKWPPIDITRNPHDPSGFHVKLKFNVPWEYAGDMVVMNPVNNVTHSWTHAGVMRGYLCCTRCHIHKLVIAETDIEFGLCSNTIAQYDLSCDECIVKDIIE